VEDEKQGLLKQKVFIDFCSSIDENGVVYLSCCSFPDDMKYFEERMVSEDFAVSKTSQEEDSATDAAKTKETRKFKVQICEGEQLEKAMRAMPQFVKEKRIRMSKKNKSAQQQAISIANLRFNNIQELKKKVKDIQSSRIDGEELKSNSTDYKLIMELLSKYHPTGDKKLENEKGLKVDVSSHGETRCFYVIKSDGSQEDFSMTKIYDRMNAQAVFTKK